MGEFGMGAFEAPSREQVEKDRERRESSPEFMLDYIAKEGQNTTRIAQEQLAKIAIAKERGIEIDLSSSERMKKFALDGEYSRELYRFNAELVKIGVEMLEQGLEIEMPHYEFDKKIAIENLKREIAEKQKLLEKMEQK